MSPKFYWSLWVGFFVAAGICAAAGILTMLTATVFGFVAFGLIFTGMMCVLPTQVALDHEKAPRTETVKRAVEPREQAPSGVTKLRPA